MSIGQTEDQDVRLRELTARLEGIARRRLAAERLAVAAMEHERQLLQQELELMRGSAGLKLLNTARATALRVARAVRHPLWTTGSALHRVTSRPRLDELARGWSYLRVRSFPLRLGVPLDAPGVHAEDRATQWIGTIAVRYERHDALLCTPDASIEYRVTAPSGSRFLTWIAILPDAWLHKPGPVTFTVRIDAPALSWRAQRQQTIDPGKRYTDRRWWPLSIQLPYSSASAIDITVRLETHGPRTQALFGDPRVEWTRPPADVLQSVRTFTSHARRSGLAGAFGLMQRARSADEDAERYARWLAAHEPTADRLRALAAEVTALPRQPLISIITPVFNTDQKWLRACVESVRAQVYPNWELCLSDDASTSAETIATLREYENDPRIRMTRLSCNEGISRASNAALAAASGEYVALLDHDDELTPDALAEIVRWINARPDADVIYSDEDKLDLAGQRCEPCFKPDWSPEHFLHRMYTCHFMAARRALVMEVGGFRAGYEGAQDYDLMLRLVERTTRIDHVPRILYHWRKLPESTASALTAKPWAEDAGRLALQDCVRRRGVDAEVLPGGAPGLFRIRRRMIGRPLVSLVIPTAARLRDVRGTATDLLARAIQSVVDRTDWPEYEFVIVADEAGLQSSSMRALEGTRHCVLAMNVQGPFNFSRKINAGVAASKGSHILLFNDDIEAIERDWMTAMLEYSQDAAIGAVGAKLQYPDGRLQHVGMILGVAGVAAHAYHQHPGTTEGYFGCVIGPRNVSAVTAACLMTRRDVFEEAGGFDETFPVDFNDVDYCLRLRRAGYRIVYTPYARLLHHESASFGARTQDPSGIDEMRRRWRNTIENDPYYNPNLTRDTPDYRLGPI